MQDRSLLLMVYRWGWASTVGTPCPNRQGQNHENTRHYPDHDTRFLHAHTQTHTALHTGLKLVSCILQNLFYVPFYLSAHFDDHSFVDFMWLCLINNSLSLHPKCFRLTSLFWDLKASVSDIWKTSWVIQQHYRLFSVNGGHLSKRMTIILMENVAKK